MFQFLLEQVPNIVLTLLGVSLVRSWIRSRWPKISETYLDIALGVLLIVTFVVSGVNRSQESREAAQQQKTIDAMREYSVVARLNPYGVTGMAGQGLKETPDSRLAGIEETWVQHENNRSPKCDDSSIEKSRAVTTSFPQFPWSYFS